MVRHILFFVCLQYPIFLFAQSDGKNPGAKSAALGSTSSVIAGAESIFGNSAGLTHVKKKTILIAPALPYGMSALAVYSAAFILPLKNGTGAIATSKYGNTYYNEQKVNLAYAHKIDFMSLGAAVNVSRINISEYGSRTAIIGQLGGRAELNPKLVFGANIYNLNLAKISKGENLPVIMQAGLCWQAIESVSLLLETEKELTSNQSIKTGLEYKIKDFLFLRSGFSTAPAKAHLGIGLQNRKWDVNYAGITNPFLGMSHYFSLHYKL